VSPSEDDTKLNTKSANILDPRINQAIEKFVSATIPKDTRIIAHKNRHNFLPMFANKIPESERIAMRPKKIPRSFQSPTILINLLLRIGNTEEVVPNIV
jgi:hypothetical protein